MGIVNKEEPEMQTWIRDGERVEGRYFAVPFRGRVVESRVKYGGSVEYTVDLDEPITLPWRDEPRHRVLVSAAELDLA
jgi:hypothetical protein